MPLPQKPKNNEKHPGGHQPPGDLPSKKTTAGVKTRCQEGSWGGRLGAEVTQSDHHRIPIGGAVSASPSRFFRVFLAGTRKTPAGGMSRLNKRLRHRKGMPYFLSGEKVCKEPPRTFRMVLGLSRRPKGETDKLV